MNRHELQEIEQGLHGLFWKYVQKVAAQVAEDKRKEGVSMIPENLGQMNEREQLFGADKGIVEFISMVPDRIKDEIKKAELENPQTDE